MSDCAGRSPTEGLSPNLDALSPKLAGLSPNLKPLSLNLCGETIRRYLARMMRNGRLAPIYREQPNHPQQAYRVAKILRALW